MCLGVVDYSIVQHPFHSLGVNSMLVFILFESFSSFFLISCVVRSILVYFTYFKTCWIPTWRKLLKTIAYLLILGKHKMPDRVALSCGFQLASHFYWSPPIRLYLERNVLIHMSDFKLQDRRLIPPIKCSCSWTNPQNDRTQYV